MKKMFKIPGIVLGVILLCITSLAHFASQCSEARFPEKTPVYDATQREVLAILEADYPKVARQFAAVFPAATDQLWIRDGSVLFARFSNKNNKVTAVFTATGKMNYAVCYIKEADLPQEVRHRIKNDYPFYSIFNAREILSQGNTFYQVILEGTNGYVHIQVNGHEVVEMERLLKQPKKSESKENQYQAYIRNH